ncbi:hypothetical protein QQX09_05845 [Demequina sp. SYSU T00192]|uniref:Uncharacterized protein n=1 Tax=Demequina litoralis TaxID=3051660 RepID=A0ABT8G8A2_9MICO|nr:hypothetical protein [Demequina sp. SYSU T00192]MDN4475378.1 hypothetical protein [Demequina sp. SYSU T00192]
MIFNAGDRVFVDESKSNVYVMAATAVAPAAHADVRRSLRRLLRAGQTRLHFTRESDSRRREILATMNGLDVRSAVWAVRGESDRVARPRCLVAMVGAFARDGVAELLLECDASLERSDRQVIERVLRSGRERPGLTYRHVPPTEDPVLWVSDAVAWCVQRRGEWLRRIEPLVERRVMRP